jgi:hypothetical protein
VKRLFRTIAVIGGIAGVVWAMRERLISISVSGESERPEFRTPNEDGKSPDGA